MTSASAAESITPRIATDGPDILYGSAAADDLNGLGGDDLLFGLEGGDKLSGGDGNDTLDGGPGADSLEGEGGDDVLLGGDGDDSLYDSAGNNTLRGGNGNDKLEVASNAYNALYGEAGNDVLVSSRGSGLLDGGSGNDEFYISAYASADGPQSVEARGGEGRDSFVTALGSNAGLSVLLSGGSGSDTFTPATRAPLGAGTVTITDFTAGMGGDLIDITRLALPTGGNVFGSGSWANPGSARLVQRGADTVLQVRSVFSDSAPFDDVLVLRNVVKETLTAMNFSFGFNPDGSSTGQVLALGAADDHAAGGWLNDDIDGGGGNDVLYGSLGDDRLKGGEGDDLLDGDRVESRPGADTPWAAERSGDDLLDGGAGNDTLFTSWGNDTLLGGAGNDRLVVLTGAAPAGGQRVVLDGGEGQDRFEILRGGTIAPDIVMTGGAGSDSFSFDGPPVSGAWTITDFQAGAGGDVLDVFDFLGWSRESPFASGYLRFEQRGADTVVQYDADGTNPNVGFVDIVTLSNVAATTLRSENMRYGYLPDSAVAMPGPPIIGGAGKDRLQGGALADQLEGGAGDDILLGGAGNDLLHGGAGLDTAVFSGTRSDYSLTPNFRLDLYVADLRGGVHDGRDWLVDVERLEFADGAVALDTGFDDVAGQAYRIYRAAFHRTPDEAGLGYWIAAMDRGTTLAEVADGFASSEEFKALYGTAPSNAEMVIRLYQNILDRAPEQAGFDFWLGVLDQRLVDLPAMLAAFSESAENRQAVAELIGNGVYYQPFGG